MNVADGGRRKLSSLRKRLAGGAEQRTRQVLAYANLATLGARYGVGPGLAGHELKVFSQNGEDGVIAEIFHRIGTTNRCFVEFGIGGGVEGNSVLLADVQGWEGLFIEGSPELWAQLAAKYQGVDRIRTRQAFVYPWNLGQLLAEEAIPTEPDLLSIDVDGNDYWIWQGLTDFRPRVVICEYNGFIDPSTPLVQPYADGGWDETDFYGASLAALRDLGVTKGYRLVHADLTGINSFFVRDDLADHFADCEPVHLRRASVWFSDFRHKPDPLGRSYVVPDPTGAPVAGPTA